MSEVWKYPLDLVHEQIVPMPADAVLLHVAEQYGTLCLWAWVSTEFVRLPVDRVILVRGTGQPIEGQPYIGTVVASNSLVWHVFDGGVE